LVVLRRVTPRATHYSRLARNYQCIFAEWRRQYPVSDTGIGIDPALQPHVFELFAQASRTPDRSQGGLGLGLALAKSLVELHGGALRCFSEGVGKGACFTITLPRASDPVAEDAPPPPGVGMAVGDKALRILVVDDNVDAARMLAMMLEHDRAPRRVRARHRPARDGRQ
jgi:hypothetical protein